MDYDRCYSFIIGWEYSADGKCETMPSTRSLNRWFFPFNSPDGNNNLDMAFLFVSAIKYIFRALQTMGIGLFTTFFRLGYWANVQSSYYYLTIQMVAGSFQPTGSPSIVAMIRNWFSKENSIVPGILIAFSKYDSVPIVTRLSKIYSSKEVESTPFAFCIFWWLTHFSIVAVVLYWPHKHANCSMIVMLDMLSCSFTLLCKFDERAITAPSFMYCVIPSPTYFEATKTSP
uniref:Uncharacterized protein n=1 Tax=Solanum lycopersicum TaxID=4081 RepID=A0A3Q7HAA2_SOLLC